jgi:hypothetical protein
LPFLEEERSKCPRRSDDVQSLDYASPIECEEK